MIYIVDDDEIMAECIARACGNEARIFANGIEAIEAMDEEGLPDLIFLDIMLDGPDGFTFLNELVTYEDTGKIPVVIVTSLPIEMSGLAPYGVVGLLKKETMNPGEILAYAEKFAK